jgi:heme exporter protein A
MQAPRDPAPLLAAEGLACRRGARLLFRGLSLRLESGAACHVTGANGAGKTTLIRTLAGLASPFAGSVTRAGAAGLLVERRGLDPELPLAAALAFWFGIDRVEDARQIMARLRLAALAEVPVRYLSTGQHKRAALARLLGQRAPIWLLDEPLSGLDGASQTLVSELVQAHCQGGGIALIASHQPLDVPGLSSLALEDFAPATADEEEAQT